MLGTSSAAPFGWPMVGISFSVWWCDLIVSWSAALARAAGSSSVNDRSDGPTWPTPRSAVRPAPAGITRLRGARLPRTCCDGARLGRRAPIPARRPSGRAPGRRTGCRAAHRLAWPWWQASWFYREPGRGQCRGRAFACQSPVGIVGDRLHHRFTLRLRGMSRRLRWVSDTGMLWGDRPRYRLPLNRFCNDLPSPSPPSCREPTAKHRPYRRAKAGTPRIPPPVRLGVASELVLSRLRAPPPGSSSPCATLR